MNSTLRIEYYLGQLDQYLRGLPVSQRADIVSEMKSHIYELIERSPNLSVDEVLIELGPPKEVAKKYLEGKGIALSAPPRTGWIFKWLAIGTVALFAFIFVGGLATVWYLSPILSIDKKDGSIKVLGGFVRVEDDLGKIRIGGIDLKKAWVENGQEVSGDQVVADHDIRLVKVPFNTAKIDVRETSESVIRWTCTTMDGESPAPTVTAGVMNFQLDQLNVAKCLISIPYGMASEFNGVNGNMNVDSPSSAMKISLVNGKVKLRLDPDRIYDVDVKIKNGLTDFFPRSSAKKAVKVKVDVVNGLVKKD